MRQIEEFTPLRMVRRSLTDFDRSTYRVYKSAAEYVTVEAATALEALRESGIKHPVRILRETRFMERLLDEQRFTDQQEIVESVVMEAPSAITGHREAVPQAAPRSAPPATPAAPPSTATPQPEDALSADDIQSLLAEDAAMKSVQDAADAAPKEEVLSPDDIAKLLGDGEQG